VPDLPEPEPLPVPGVFVPLVEVAPLEPVPPAPVDPLDCAATGPARDAASSNANSPGTGVFIIILPSIDWKSGNIRWWIDVRRMPEVPKRRTRNDVRRQLCSLHNNLFERIDFYGLKKHINF
jgi:hypothetical protein